MKKRLRNTRSKALPRAANAANPKRYRSANGIIDGGNALVKSKKTSSTTLSHMEATELVGTASSDPPPLESVVAATPQPIPPESESDFLQDLLMKIVGEIQAGRNPNQLMLNPLTEVNGDGIIAQENQVKNAPLHIAAHLGDIGIMRTLLDLGADIHQKDSLDETPLFYAVGAGPPQAVMYLLLKENYRGGKGGWSRAILQPRGARNENLLIAAVRGGSIQKFDLLMHILERAKVSSSSTEHERNVQEFVNHRDTGGFTPVFWTSSRELGLREACSFLDSLARVGARLDDRDDNGDTLLRWAVAYLSDALNNGKGVERAAKYLFHVLTHEGVSQNISDDEWCGMIEESKQNEWPAAFSRDFRLAVLYHLAGRGRAECIQKLSLAQRACDIWNNTCALHAAVRSFKDLQETPGEELSKLTRKAHNKKKSEEVGTPTMWDATKGAQLKVLRLFLKYQRVVKNINVVDGGGNSALSCAVEVQNELAVLELVRVPGIDIDHKEPVMGQTPLMMAVGGGGRYELTIAEALIAAQARVDVLDSDMYGVLHWATDRRYQTCLRTLKLLLATLARRRQLKQALLQHCSISGNLVFHQLFSKAKPDPEVVRELLKAAKGANCRDEIYIRRNKWGFTALELCAAYNHKEKHVDKAVEYFFDFCPEEAKREFCHPFRIPVRRVVPNNVHLAKEGKCELSNGLESPKGVYSSDPKDKETANMSVNSLEAAFPLSFQYTCIPFSSDPGSFRYYRQLPFSHKHEILGCLCGGQSDVMSNARTNARTLIHGRSVYNDEGRLNEVLLKTFANQSSGRSMSYCIWECNENCSCASQLDFKCPNRVVGNAMNKIQFDVEIFDSGATGYGLLAMEFIPKGSYLCEYAGEVVRATAGKDQTYLFDLCRPCESDDPLDVTEFQIDGRIAGNCARFVNHSHTPNLIAVDVFVNDIIVEDSSLSITKNRKKSRSKPFQVPRSCFFSSRDIQPGEPLTFNYGYNEGEFLGRAILCACGCEGLLC